ncbi:MAG: sigma-70 family RNA polymerase sigma factor [Phycisphaerae bacterium]|nr:sigma-70 family RNA polymerase sigma factor [Phycisphaerae bacterium]
MSQPDQIPLPLHAPTDIAPVAVPAPPREVASAPADSPLADFDTQLMLLVCQGDEEAARQLVNRNFAKIARFIGKVVQMPRVVEDLTQEVFVRAFRAKDRYEPTARFQTWVYRIAMNVARNHLDRAEVRRTTPRDPSDLALFRDANCPNPENDLDRSEVRKQVSDAIAALPIGQRVPLTLFELDEMSYEQIAAVMEITVEGVRARLLRARQTLRERLRHLM